MIQEMNRLQFLKNYKSAKVVFLKGESNDYIDGLQMLIYLDGIKNPVYATKLNCFEFCTIEQYKLNRVWSHIPFIFNPVKEEIKKIKMKDKEDAKLRKFLAKFNYRTSRMIYNEVLQSTNKLDSSSFSERPAKPKRTGVVVVNPQMI